MVLSIGTDGNADYYVRHMVDYYAGGIEPLGKWYTPSHQFGLINGTEFDASSKAAFTALMAGFSPDGEMIGRPPKNPRLSRTSSYDLTFSAPKSVSVLWAAAADEDRAKLQAAQEAAVRRALQTAQRYTAFLRRGNGGDDLVKTEMFGATFQHGDARPMDDGSGYVKSDMNLHTHAVIFNLAQDEREEWYALDARHVLKWKMALGATYHAELAYLITSQFQAGIRVKGRNGEFEVLNIPSELIDHFSRRRAQVVEQMKAHGLTTADAPMLAAAIGRATREAKPDPDQTESPDERFDRWASEMLALGYDPVELTAAALYAPPPAGATAAEKEAEFEDAIDQLPFLITETNAVVQLCDIHRHVAALCTAHGKGADVVDAIVDRVRSHRSVPANLLEWDDVEFDEYIRKLEDENRLVELPNLTDLAHRPLYTAPDLLRAERGIWRLVDLSAADRRHVLPYDLVERYIAQQRATDRPLTAEQAQALRWLTTEPGLVSVLEGGAGTGKSISMRGVTALYRDLLSTIGGGNGDAAYRVVGCSAKWLTARALVVDADLADADSRAAAKWIHDIQTGAEKVGSRTIMIVDEAGQMGSRDLYDLLEPFVKAGAKIVLTGDRLQQRSVGAGLALDIVVSRIGSLRLERTQRMQPQADDVILHRDGVSREEAVMRSLGMSADQRRSLISGKLGTLRHEILCRFRDAEYRPTAEDVLIWAHGLAPDAARTELARLDTNERVRLANREGDIARDNAIAWAKGKPPTSLPSAPDGTPSAEPDDPRRLAALVFRYVEDLPLAIAVFRPSLITEQELHHFLHGRIEETKAAIAAWAADPETHPNALEVLRWADGQTVAQATARLATLTGDELNALLARGSEAVVAAARFARGANRPLAEDVLHYALGSTWDDALKRVTGLTQEERADIVRNGGAMAAAAADRWADSPDTITAADVLVHLYGFERTAAEARAAQLDPDNAARLVDKHATAVKRAGQIWTRSAATDFSYGPTDASRAFAALKAFADHGHLKWGRSHDDALAAAVADWKVWRSINRDPLLTAIVIAKSNTDVRELNRLMRDYHREQGAITGEDHTLDTIDRQRVEVTLPIAVGEQVMFTRRHSDLGVVNGTIATVVAVERSKQKGHLRLTVALASDGRALTFDTADYADEKSGFAMLEHSYATTTFSAQGATRSVCFAQIDSSQKANSVYVAASRATALTYLYASRGAEDQFLRASMPFSELESASFTDRDRLRSLARHVARAYDKTTTMDALDPAWRDRAQERTTRAAGYYEDETLWWRALSSDDQHALMARALEQASWERAQPPTWLEEGRWEETPIDAPAVELDIETPTPTPDDYGPTPEPDDAPDYDAIDPDAADGGNPAAAFGGDGIPGQPQGRMPEYVRRFLQHRADARHAHTGRWRGIAVPDADALPLFKAGRPRAAGNNSIPEATPIGQALQPAQKIDKEPPLDPSDVPRPGPSRPRFMRELPSPDIEPSEPLVPGLVPPVDHVARVVGLLEPIRADGAAPGAEDLPLFQKAEILDRSTGDALLLALRAQRARALEEDMAPAAANTGEAPQLARRSVARRAYNPARRTEYRQRYDSKQIGEEMDLLDSHFDFHKLLQDAGWKCKGSPMRSVNQDWTSTRGETISVKFNPRSGRWGWTDKSGDAKGSVRGFLRTFDTDLRVPRETPNDFINLWLFARNYIPGAPALPSPDETEAQRTAREAASKARLAEIAAEQAQEQRHAVERYEVDAHATWSRHQGDWLRLHTPAATSAGNILERRGISRSTQYAYAEQIRFDPIFGYAAFAHRRPDGTLTGFERKGENGYNKFTDGTATKCIAVFRRGDAPIARIVIAETGVDALSLAQMDEAPADTIYVSTGGMSNDEGKDAVRALSRQHPQASFVLATDRDAGGELQATGWAEVLLKHPGRVVRLVPELVNDWNNQLRFGSAAHFSVSMYAKDLRKASPSLPPPLPERPDLLFAWQLWEQARPFLGRVREAIASGLGATFLSGPLAGQIDDAAFNRRRGPAVLKDIISRLDGDTPLDAAIDQFSRAVFPGRNAWNTLEPHVDRLRTNVARGTGAVMDGRGVVAPGTPDTKKLSDLGATDFFLAIEEGIRTKALGLADAIQAAIEAVRAADGAARTAMPDRSATISVLQAAMVEIRDNPDVYAVRSAHMHEDPLLYPLLMVAQAFRAEAPPLPDPSNWVSIENPADGESDIRPTTASLDVHTPVFDPRTGEVLDEVAGPAAPASTEDPTRRPFALTERAHPPPEPARPIQDKLSGGETAGSDRVATATDTGQSPAEQGLSELLSAIEAARTATDADIAAARSRLHAVTARAAESMVLINRARSPSASDRAAAAAIARALDDLQQPAPLAIHESAPDIDLAAAPGPAPADEPVADPERDFDGSLVTDLLDWRECHEDLSRVLGNPEDDMNDQVLAALDDPPPPPAHDPNWEHEGASDLAERARRDSEQRATRAEDARNGLPGWDVPRTLRGGAGDDGDRRSPGAPPERGDDGPKDVGQDFSPDTTQERHEFLRRLCEYYETNFAGKYENDIAHVVFRPGRFADECVIFFRDGSRLRDDGVRLRVDGAGTGQKAALIIEIARAKGLTSVTLCGTPEFKAMMAYECHLWGIEVTNIELRKHMDVLKRNFPDQAGSKAPPEPAGPPRQPFIPGSGGQPAAGQKPPARPQATTNGAPAPAATQGPAPSEIVAGGPVEGQGEAPASTRVESPEAQRQATSTHAGNPAPRPTAKQADSAARPEAAQTDRINDSATAAETATAYSPLEPAGLLAAAVERWSQAANGAVRAHHAAELFSLVAEARASIDQVETAAKLGQAPSPEAARLRNAVRGMPWERMKCDAILDPTRVASGAETDLNTALKLLTREANPVWHYVNADDIASSGLPDTSQRSLTAWLDLATAWGKAERTAGELERGGWRDAVDYAQTALSAFKDAELLLHASRSTLEIVRQAGRHGDVLAVAVSEGMNLGHVWAGEASTKLLSTEAGRQTATDQKLLFVVEQHAAHYREARGAAAGQAGPEPRDNSQSQ